MSTFLLPSDFFQRLLVDFFFCPGAGRVILELIHPLIVYHEARHALTAAVYHVSKMRAQVAADARVTSGALYL